MTREEAINVLGNFKRYISGGGVTSRTDTEAINMAIEALNREQLLIDCGHQNAEIDFYIDGLLFKAKKMKWLKKRRNSNKDVE